MGCRELIASLRAARDEKIIAIWDAAEDAAQQARTESREKLEEFRTRLQEEQAATAAERTAAVMAEASHTVRDTRIAAERRLADRLLTLAKEALPGLRHEGYQDTFRTLARELPPLAWQAVKVNPQDQDLARALFPAAKIIVDDAISGGLEVSAEGEKVTMANTLNVRLERAWDELLPVLIAEVYESITNGAHKKK